MIPYVEAKNASGGMKMKTRTIWAFFAVFLISAIAFTGIAYAYRGNTEEVSPNYSSEVHEQLKAAIESGDYDEWLRLREGNGLPTYGRMFQVINRENFEKYRDLHNANLAGDVETANSIKAELGLGLGQMKRGMVGSQGQGNLGNGAKFQGANCETCLRVRN